MNEHEDFRVEPVKDVGSAGEKLPLITLKSVGLGVLAVVVLLVLLVLITQIFFQTRI